MVLSTFIATSLFTSDSFCHIDHVIAIITTYPMTALPASGYATITVNKFNTSLPIGQVLVNFTISSLKANTSYIIKRSGTVLNTTPADSSGTINFNNSNWLSAHVFTVEEAPLGTGSITCYAMHVNQTTPIPDATVSLYYQGGAPAGLPNVSGADGKFVFTNIASGSYFVNITKACYQSNQSSVFTVSANATIDIGAISLMLYDVYRDGIVDIGDLTVVAQHFYETPNPPYPVYDVNGDGVVDFSDVDLVMNNLG